jgi:hypothetical protein
MVGMASSSPGSAREIVRTITQAVDAASGGAGGEAYGAEAYGGAVARLATVPAAGRVLGDVLRSVLEDTHPDGLDSADITLVTSRCYRAATAWLPPDRVNVAVLLAALASALGIHEPGITYAALDLPGPAPDEWRDPGHTAPIQPPTWLDYAWHAPLLLADLLPFAPATLGGYLETAFGEYAREAREELP